jgi:hypothetical protein
MSSNWEIEKDKDGNPRSAKLRINHFRLSIHRHIHYDPDIWLFSTVPNLFEGHALGSKTIEFAMQEAMQLFLDRLKIVQRELNYVAGTMAIDWPK